MKFDDHLLLQMDAGEGDIPGLDIALMLSTLPPSERAMKLQLFQKYSADIEDALKRAVPKGKILAGLAAMGLKLSPNTFAKMLKAERTRRTSLQPANMTTGSNMPEPINNDDQEVRHD